MQDNDGRIMVAKGAALTESIISRLRYLGFRGLYIGDLISEDIEIPEAISPELRNLAKECIKTLDVKGSVKISHSIMRQQFIDFLLRKKRKEEAEKKKLAKTSK